MARIPPGGGSVKVEKSVRKRPPNMQTVRGDSGEEIS
jgi:hypothetical protein